MIVVGCSAWCRDYASILMPVVFRDVPVSLDPFGLGPLGISLMICVSCYAFDFLTGC